MRAQERLLVRAASSLAELAREPWKGRERVHLKDVPTVLGVPYGDVCRAVRDGNNYELPVELANLVLTATRMIEESGVSVAWALGEAQERQRRWAAEHDPV